MRMNVTKVLLLVFASTFLFSCSGDSSEKTTEEMQTIEEDAQKAIEEVEEESDKLENEIDSLLRDI